MSAPGGPWPHKSVFETAFTPEKHTLLLSLVLVASVLICYLPAAHNGFLNYDDDAYITSNLHVRAGVTRATVKWAFTTYDAANYHPLTWLSHALDCQLFGVNSAAHHEVSVLLHAANAVLLFLLLLRASRFAWRSLFVAALFALHPVNVESVAWAAERKNVLSMLFFLLALHGYVWYARRTRMVRYFIVILLFVLALLSKPQVITFPFLLLLLDYWPLRRMIWGGAAVQRCEDGAVVNSDSTVEGTALAREPLFPEPPRRSVSWLIVEKIPFVLLSAASAVVTMKAQRAGGAVQSLTQYSPLLRCETAVISYVRYLGKAFWPSKLVALYPHPTSLYPGWQVGAALSLLTLITFIVLRHRGRRYLAFGWLWFLAALVPMLGLVQVGSQAMADRYAYIPFIGLFVMFTWLVADWVEAHWIEPRWIKTRHVSVAVVAAAIAYLGVLGTLTYRQVSYWHDTQSFWERTIALTRNNYVAHDSLGEYLAREGHTEEAAVQFRAALAIRPDDLPANLNLGTYYHGHGNLRAAIDRYQMVAFYAADPTLRATAYGNLGSAYRQQGDTARAKQYFENALEAQPNRPMPMVLIGLGLIAQKNGEFAEAVRDYSRAMGAEPTDVGYLLLAQALEDEGHKDGAKAIRERLQKLSPDLDAAKKQAESLLGKWGCADPTKIRVKSNPKIKIRGQECPRHPNKNAGK
jgi:tetratricopeptide (TPR) repeat protein